MNIFFKQFFPLPYNFVTSRDAETLNADMLAFCDRSFWDFSVNMRGRAKGDGYYSFLRRWEIGNVQGLGLMLPRLRAKIVSAADGYSVEVVTGSSYISLVYVVVFVVVGLVVLLMSFVGDDGFNWELFVLALILIFIVPAGIARQNYFSRLRLLTTFADRFGLTQP